MDPMRAWLVMGLWQKLCFLFLFTVTAVTLVRALRLWWSPMRLREGSGRPPPSDDSTALRAWQASKLAGSTRGLAQAALWFTCAGAAFGLHSAGNTLGSGRPILAIVAENSFDVVDASGLGLVWCALLFVAAWGFEASSPNAIGQDRLLGVIGRGRPLLWPVAMMLIAATLFELRPAFTAVAGEGGHVTGHAIFVALWHLWSRLSVLSVAMGTLAWLSVLLDSAMARRRRPA